MFKTKEELLSRLSNNSVKDAPLPLNRSGNGTGTTDASHNLDDSNRGSRPEGSNVPDEVRATIGALARISGISKTTEAFDVNRKVVQDARLGYHTHAKEQNLELTEKIKDILKPTRDAAIERTLSVIKNITDDKLKENSAPALSKIAANLSTVVRNLTVPEVQNAPAAGAQATVVIHGTPRKTLEEYTGIEVS